MRGILVAFLGCSLAIVGNIGPPAVWGQTLVNNQNAAKAEPSFLAEDFEGEPRGDWSLWQAATTPANRNTFLGEFGPQTVTLSIHKLPPHKMLRVSFDLYIIRSWDGSQTIYGPDIWQLSLVNGPTLLRTTFNNCQRVGSDEQAYPDNYPSPPHPCWTGAAAHESLGYSYQFKTRGTVPMDAVYRIQAVVPHSGLNVGLQFAAIYNDKLIENQSWGIDNLEVQLVDEFETLSDEQFKRHWEMLVHEDPAKAIEAMWRLVAAGDNATRSIVNALHIDDQQLQKEITEGTRLLGALTKLDPPEREILAELAAERLASLSPQSISILRERFRLESAKILDVADAIRAKSPVRQYTPMDEQWRLRRAKRALSIIDTPQARRALWTLSEPGKFETNDEQYLETQLKCE